MKAKAVLVLASLLAATPLMAQDTLDNSTIVTLTQAALGDDAIIAKIRASSSHFDVSTDRIIELRKQGVSGPVIAAMINAANPAAGQPAALSLDAADPSIPHASGVYLLADWAPEQRMLRIDPTVSTQSKTGGIFGYALTGGIASMSIKAAIANATARVSSHTTRPTFYFFFDASNTSTANQPGTWASGTAATVTSPNEFTLVHLTQKQGRREARVGSVNIGGAKAGVMDKDRIPFDYEMIRPGVFKATPNALLAPGEYGFIYSLVGGGAGGVTTARIFDFSVKT